MPCGASTVTVSDRTSMSITRDDAAKVIIDALNDAEEPTLS
jgi:hypothetical protein